tara:strand:+ start:712 stop:1578 length:867 start_codon:yes stop_codon:yes gene_type:complete
MSTIKLKGSSSGEAQVTVAAAAGTPTFTLPTTVGSANQLLKNSGTAGTLQYASVLEDSSGNVKIGEATTDYTYKLTVSGNGSTDNGLFMYDGNAGTWFGIKTGAANGLVTLTADARSGNYPPLTFKVGNSEKLRIQSGGGISFNGDTAAANALDDYEEGTWTGTIKHWDSSAGWTTSGFDTSPSNTTGLYTRVGRMVHVEIYINGFDVNSSATGDYAAISGLPFADTTNDNHYGVISFAHDSCFANTAGGGYVEGSMIRPTDAGTTTNSTWKSGGPLYLMLSGTYEIN